MNGEPASKATVSPESMPSAHIDNPLALLTQAAGGLGPKLPDSLAVERFSNTDAFAHWLERHPEGTACVDAATCDVDNDARLADLMRAFPFRQPLLLADRECLVRALALSDRMGAGLILPDEGWEDAPDWREWVRWGHSGQCDDPMGIFLEPGCRRERFEVRGVEDLETVGEMLMNVAYMLGLTRQEIYDYRLVLEELLNNAIYHAFVGDDGREKYRPQTFGALDAKDSVIVVLGYGKKYLGFSIIDNTGRLARRILLARIRRQLEAYGLYDEGGRGLYLAFILAHRLIIRIRPGIMTEATAGFFIPSVCAESKRSIRPLLIFDR